MRRSRLFPGLPGSLGARGTCGPCRGGDTPPVTASETIPCPICNVEDVKALFAGDGFVLGRCSGCGFVRQNPRPTADHIRTSNYDGAAQKRRSYFGRKLGRDDLEHWQSQPLEAYEAGVLAVDAQRRPTGPNEDAPGDVAGDAASDDASPQKGLWLDVGASTGQLLVAAHNAGYDVGGVELGSGQVKLCKEVHGFDVFHGTLAEAAFPDGHADVVSYRHVLEHIHDLLGELQEAQRVLRPDGLLLVEVPNFGGLRYKWGRLRTTLKLTKSIYRKLNLPEHLYYFTIDSLRHMLDKTGFDVLSWGTYGKTRSRRGAARKGYDALRDGLKIGNKLRVVARKRSD